MKQDIRWIQRYSNYQKALLRLQDFIDTPELNIREEQGMIKAFEYTFELAWKTIKDFYEYQGETNIQGSKDSFRLAFNRGLIKDGDIWMEMIIDRNNTSHTYDEETANEILFHIRQKFYGQFVLLRDELEILKNREQ